MKALIVITGRGLGGDAVIALNVISGLEKQGIECEIALDKNAPGILFEKNGYSWHKISIPQAGGHAATKASTIKAAFKMLSATFEARKLIKKLDVDFVVGVIGGGAIVGAVGSKLARTPSISIICTPLDFKVCSKFNKCLALPETRIIKEKDHYENILDILYPIDKGIVNGNKEIAFEKLKKEKNFDENKKTILFSSGSSIFKGMIEGLNNFSKFTDDYNLVLVGLPLEDEYLDILDMDKVIYLGYVNWMKDLLSYIDLAVLTDDGVSIQEAMACEIPIVALTHVKWGRYHNMAGIFKGAILESEVDNLNEVISEALDNLDDLKDNVKLYSEDSINSTKNIVQKIMDEMN